MSGYLNEREALQLLQDAHDNLKACAFRSTFDAEDLPEYVLYLEELSHAWGTLCYSVKRSEAEQKLFYKFCSWQHGYNTLLLRYSKDKQMITLYTPYFELMLNVTHVYLDTGKLDVFYRPYIYTQGTSGSIRELLSPRGEKWVLVTSEMCKIESSELPRYYPVSVPICVDSAKMKNYFMTRFSHGNSEEERTRDFETWERETKPVLEWINKNLVPKSKQTNDMISPLHCSAGE